MYIYKKGKLPPTARLTVKRRGQRNLYRRANDCFGGGGGGGAED